MGMSTWIIGAVIIVIIVFVIVSSITSKKAQKKEQLKRKKVVREEIKTYLSKTQNRKNITVEYEKVYARKGPEYKYRDVFDVVVKIIEPKTNEVIENAAYEVEGITTKIDKKNYKTNWKVNGIVDLEETKRRIAIAEKVIKLNKVERKELKVQDKEISKLEKVKVKEDYKKAKETRKIQTKDSPEMDKVIKKTTIKFVPTRNK